MLTAREFGISRLLRLNHYSVGLNRHPDETARRIIIFCRVAFQMQAGAAVVVRGHSGCTIFVACRVLEEYVALVPFTLRLLLYVGCGTGERVRGSNAAPDNPAFQCENRSSGLPGPSLGLAPPGPTSAALFKMAPGNFQAGECHRL